MRTTPRLALDFVRHGGVWRGRAAVAAALEKIMPALLRAAGGLPPNDYVIAVALQDDAAQQALNHQFRGLDRATNVLAFPQYGKAGLKTLTPQKTPVFLGDISLASPYVQQEARRDGKSAHNHIIHLVIHGILHILGHDHQTARQAAVMEQVERDVLAIMKIADPYAPGPTLPRAPQHRAP